MTALTADRGTPRRDGRDFEYLVAAATKIFAGALVCIDTGASGYAKPGATSTTLRAVGVAQAAADNSAGAAGAIRVQVRQGVHLFKNSASADQITAADIEADCYIVDDQTVAKTSGSSTRSIAGKVKQLEADGSVWVKVGG